MNASQYTQIGVEISLYSGKSRSYLRHKRIPFVERPTNPWEFFFKVPRRTQALAVPVVDHAGRRVAAGHERDHR